MPAIGRPQNRKTLGRIGSTQPSRRVNLEMNAAPALKSDNAHKAATVANTAI